MNKLLAKMLDAGSMPSSTLEDSIFFNEKEAVTTELPILNVAFSGRLDGGLTSGLTVFAGESKSFKTMLALYCMKAYFNKYKDAVAIFYDSEFGTPPSYLKQFGLDLSRIIHVPIVHIEALKFDITKRLEAIERGDKVFIMVDSLGNLASKKETEDALAEKSVADMSRAKAIKSLFRIITPHLTTRNLPCIMINHIYKEIGMFPKNIVAGGTGVMYSANQVFIITKAQEKDGTELAGYKFTINIEKSRFVKEKSKLPFTVLYNKGIQKYSGLWDLAVEAGILKQVTKQSYEANGVKRKSSDIEEDVDFWEDLIHNETFKDYVSSRYMLTTENELKDDSE